MGAGLVGLVRSGLRSSHPTDPTVEQQPAVAPLSAEGLREVTAQLHWLGLVDDRGSGSAAQVVADHGNSARELLTIAWGQFCGVIAVLGDMDWPTVLDEGLPPPPRSWMYNGWQAVPTAAPTCTQRFPRGAKSGMSTMNYASGPAYPGPSVELSAEGLHQVAAQFYWLGLVARSGVGCAARVVADHQDNHELLLALLWAQFCGLVDFLAGLEGPAISRARGGLPTPPKGWFAGGWQVLPTSAPWCVQRFPQGCSSGLQ
jgi:hypothetical protein